MESMNTGAFRRKTLAGAIGLALALSGLSVQADPVPGVYFTPFADDPDTGTPPDPTILADAMLAPGSGISVLSADFQGNTGVSATYGGYQFGVDGEGADGGYYPDGGYSSSAPDTVLGFFSGSDGSVVPALGGSASPIATDDDSSPIGDGLADALQTTGSVSELTIAVSGFDDFDFDGLADSTGLGHEASGPYVLYLSVLDGVDDPDFSGGADPGGIDPDDPFDPVTQADLAIAGFLGSASSEDVHVFSFDGASDTFTLPADAFVVAPDFDPLTFDPSAPPDPSGVLSDFFTALDSGNPIAAILDNDPLGSYGGTPTEFLGSASFVDGMNLGVGPDGEDLNFGDGILLTSGVGTPPDTNTSGSFTGIASEQGDAGLDALLQAAFDAGLFDGDGFTSAPQSTDATALAFEFTVPEGANAVAFDFMFGTEEFPNWDYPDVAAIIVDGRNYAIFDDGTPTIFDPDTPIADLLVDNDPWGDGVYDPDTGTFTPGPNAGLAIEYDGVSPVRRMVAPLDPDLAVHTFKAVVSDARDRIYDTGLFLGGMTATAFDGGSGIDPSDPVLPVPDDDPTDGFDFRLELGDAGIGLDPTTPIWIDPEIAVGYEYTVTGSTFASATLPAGYGDDLYQVSWWDPSANGGAGGYVLLDSGHDGGQFSALEIIDFTTLVSPAGVIGFQVLGIEVSAGVDPNDPTAFSTGLSFTSGGVVDVNMTPITVFVPEPGTVLLLGSGLLGLGALRRRRWRI